MHVVETCDWDSMQLRLHLDETTFDWTKTTSDYIPLSKANYANRIMKSWKLKLVGLFDFQTIRKYFFTKTTNLLNAISNKRIGQRLMARLILLVIANLLKFIFCMTVIYLFQDFWRLLVKCICQKKRYFTNRLPLDSIGNWLPLTISFYWLSTFPNFLSFLN